MKRLYIPVLLTIMLTFQGCCMSLFNESCVIYRDKVGPTTYVHMPCKNIELPERPTAFGKPQFKLVQFDSKTFYSLNKTDATSLIVNTINYKDYCTDLELLIEQNNDKNISK